MQLYSKQFVSISFDWRNIPNIAFPNFSSVFSEDLIFFTKINLCILLLHLRHHSSIFLPLDHTWQYICNIYNNSNIDNKLSLLHANPLFIHWFSLKVASHKKFISSLPGIDWDYLIQINYFLSSISSISQIYTRYRKIFHLAHQKSNDFSVVEPRNLEYLQKQHRKPQNKQEIHEAWGVDLRESPCSASVFLSPDCIIYIMFLIMFVTLKPT